MIHNIKETKRMQKLETCVWCLRRTSTFVQENKFIEEAIVDLLQEMFKHV